jgi:hypothetical protein
MQRSVANILTTHVGSLPFLALDKGIAADDATHLSDDVEGAALANKALGFPSA